MKIFIYCLYAIFGLTYFHGLMLMVGISDFVIKFSIEAFIFLLVLNSVNRLISVDKPLLFLIIGYFFMASVSAYVNDTSAFTLYRYIRYTFYGYLIFITIWSTPLPIENVRKINRFIMILFFIQIVASFVKLFVFKGSWEGIVGTTSISGGAHATVLPLFAMSFGLAFFLYYRKNVTTLFVTLAFLIIGYASNKRGIWLYTPPLLMLEYFIFMLRERKLINPGHVARFAILVALISVISVIGLLKIMSQDEKKAGFKRDLSYALSYSQEYSEGETAGGLTMGRISTSRRTLYALEDGDIRSFTIGWGPGALMGTGSSFEPLSILYGIVGWARDVISIGWIGMIIFVLFYFRLWFLVRRQASKENDPYWRAFSFGTFMAYFIFTIDHFTYGTIFAEWGLLTYVLMYATAIVISPYHQEIRQAALTSPESSTTVVPATAFPRH